MMKRKIRKRELEKAKWIICKKNSFDVHNKFESVINKEFEIINLDFSSFIPVNNTSFNSITIDFTPVVGKRG